jgi:hypothetical protein
VVEHFDGRFEIIEWTIGVEQRPAPALRTAKQPA